MSAPINPATGRPYYANFVAWFKAVHMLELEALRAAESPYSDFHIQLVLDDLKRRRDDAYSYGHPAWQAVYLEMVEYVADRATEAYNECLYWNCE